MRNRSEAREEERSSAEAEKGNEKMRMVRDEGTGHFLSRCDRSKPLSARMR
jgi:hypothetical protein